MSKKYLLNELGIMLITYKHSLLLKQPTLTKVRKLTIECIMTIEVFLVYLSSVCVSVVAVPRMWRGEYFVLYPVRKSSTQNWYHFQA